MIIGHAKATGLLETQPGSLQHSSEILGCAPIAHHGASKCRVRVIPEDVLAFIEKYAAAIQPHARCWPQRRPRENSIAPCCAIELVDVLEKVERYDLFKRLLD